MATTTLKIDGSTISFAEQDVWPVRLNRRIGAVSSLTLQRRGGPTIKPADSLLGSTVELWIDGALVFAGDVTSMDHQWSSCGWTVLYQCLCLRRRGDSIPFTDSSTLTDTAAWNLPSDDPLYLATRAGKEIGEIIGDALTMDANATALDALGIGAYADDDPWTLPAATLADLAALSTIPPGPAIIQGGKLLSAIASYLSSVAPNHVMDVSPDGTIRFWDMRDTDELTLTFEDDPISPTPLSRSVADCYQRVIIRGQPIAEPKLLSLSNGGIEEDFAWGSYDNAGAKAAWTPEDFRRDEDARSQGTCSCTDTTTVVVTSDPTTQAWGSDEWDQTHRLGSILLSSSVVTGVEQRAYRRIVSNTAKTSGGTSTLTLESALPGTSYDTYAIYGVSSGASLVWRKYKIVDEDVAAALAREFSYPFAWMYASGGAVTTTSFPVASVLWDDVGNAPPYSEQSIPFSVVGDDVIFTIPTYTVAGGKPPSDVRVVLAVNVGELTATRPASGYEGTSNTVEGLERTLTITARDWKDPINLSHMQDYAQDILDSVKNTIVEGSVTYNGLYTPALSWGNGLSITGSDYTTGWEGLNLPIVDVELTWNSDSPYTYTTTMSVSNRRAALTSANFLRPSRSTANQLFPGAPSRPPTTPFLRSDGFEDSEGFDG